MSRVNTVRSTTRTCPPYLHRLPPGLPPASRTAVANEPRAARTERPAALRWAPPALPLSGLLLLPAAGALDVRLVLGAGCPRAALGDARARHRGQRARELLPAVVVVPAQDQQELDDLPEVDVVPPRKRRVVLRVGQTRYRSGGEIHEVLAL